MNLYLSFLAVTVSHSHPEPVQRYLCSLRTVYKLPSLRFLDCSAVTQTERADAQRRGPLLEPKRVALDTSSLNANADSAAAPVANPAAPQTTQSSSEPTADEQEPQQRGGVLVLVLVMRR